MAIQKFGDFVKEQKNNKMVLPTATSQTNVKKFGDFVKENNFKVQGIDEDYRPSKKISNTKTIDDTYKGDINPIINQWNPNINEWKTQKSNLENELKTLNNKSVQPTGLNNLYNNNVNNQLYNPETLIRKNQINEQLKDLDDKINYYSVGVDSTGKIKLRDSQIEELAKEYNMNKQYYTKEQEEDFNKRLEMLSEDSKNKVLKQTNPDYIVEQEKLKKYIKNGKDGIYWTNGNGTDLITIAEDLKKADLLSAENIMKVYNSSSQYGEGKWSESDKVMAQTFKALLGSYDENSDDNSLGDTIKFIGIQVASGAISVPEGIADLLAAGLRIGSKAASKLVDNPVGEFIFGEGAGDYHNNPVYQITDDMIKNNISGEVSQMGIDKYNDTSYVKAGSLPANVAQGAGQVVGLILTGNAFDFDSVLPTNTSSKVFNNVAKSLNEPTSQAMFLSTAGNSYSQAIEEGATDGEALIYALLNAAKETGTEVMYNGLGSAFGTGALDDVVKNSVSSAIKSKALKKAAELGISMTAEGLEEVVASLLDPFIEYVYKHELDFSGYNTLMDDFLAGAFTSLVMEGGEIAINKVAGSSPNRANVSGSNIETNKEENNNAVLNEEKNNKNGGVNNSTNRTNNSTDNIEQQTDEQIQNTQEELQTAEITLSELESRKEKTSDANYRKTLEKQITNLNEKINELTTELNDTTKTKMNQVVQDGKVNIDSFQQTGVKTMLNQRGIEVSFDGSKFTDKNINAIWTKDENGNRQVIFNPNASPETIIENIAVHELTHDLMSSEKSRAALKANELLDYVKSLDGYEDARKALENAYSDIYDPNASNFKDLIDEEVVADMLGAKLGDQEFVNRLTHQKPKLAKIIYDKIIEILNRLVNNKSMRSERLYWENVKNRFETAYNTKYQSKTNKADKRAMTIGKRGAKNLSKNSNVERYNQLYALLKTAKEIANKSNESLENTNKNTKKATQWFRTKFGDWATIISDKDAKLIKKLEPNHTYKLGEILKHDLLYQAYPGLDNIRVETTDEISNSGAFWHFPGIPYNTFTTEILLNNTELNNKDFKNTILHEIEQFIE